MTLAKLARGEHEYRRPDQIAGYDLYLSFTGGPTLARLEREFGSPRAWVLYCSVDPELYFREPQPYQWDLEYMGAHSDVGMAGLAWIAAWTLPTGPPTRQRSSPAAFS